MICILAAAAATVLIVAAALWLDYRQLCRRAELIDAFRRADARLDALMRADDEPHEGPRRRS